MSVEDDDKSLESLLQSTPLRMPGGGLDARVNSVFGEFHARATTGDVARSGSSGYLRDRLGVFPWVIGRAGFGRLATAAGILVAVGIGVRLSLPNRPAPVAVAPVVASHPIQFEQETSTVYDDGVIATDEDAVYMQVRQRTVREIWYEDPAAHAKLQVVIPTEQVVIQKVEAF